MNVRTGLVLILTAAVSGGVAQAQMALTGEAAREQVNYRWFDAFGNGGVVVAGVRNAAGSYIRMMCSAGGGNPEASFQYEPKRGRLQEDEGIQVVVGEDVFHFTFGKDGFAQIDARTSRLQLDRLADALVLTKAASFLVETPRLKSSEAFSTKDAGKVLGAPGKTTVGGCG